MEHFKARCEDAVLWFQTELVYDVSDAIISIAGRPRSFCLPSDEVAWSKLCSKLGLINPEEQVASLA